MRELGRTLRGLQRGERGLAAILMGSYTLALFGLYLLKPARDSVFLSTLSAEDLPLAFILTAVLAVPATMAYGRASRSWSLPALLAVITVVVAIGLVGWWWLLGVRSLAVPYLFYAWSGVVGGVITSQFWLLGNTLCDTRQAKRLFPMLSLGGIFGAILGGVATGQLAAPLGLTARDLVLVAAGVWALALGIAALALRGERAAAMPRAGPEGRRARPVGDLVADVLGSRHLLLIIGIVAVGMLVTTFADYAFKTAAAAAHPDDAALLAFLGMFYGGMNLASLALQLLVTSRLLRGVGVGGALLVLPTLLMLGTAALVAAPGLLAASVLRGGEMSMKYSLDKTSRELLFLPLPLGLKRQVKVFVDTFVERGSRGLAGVCSCSARPRSGRCRCVGWASCWWCCWGYGWPWRWPCGASTSSFRRAVARRDISRDDLRLDLRDPQVVATLASTLASENPREVAYALAMLRSVPAGDLPPQVPDLLAHPAPEVRQRAMALVLEAGWPGLGERIEPLLRQDDVEAGRLAAAYLHDDGGEDALVRAIDRGEPVRTHVLDYLSRLPATSDVPPLITRDDLWPLLAAGDGENGNRRAAAAAFLGRTWGGSLADLREHLAGRPAPVVGAAIAGLARRGDRRHLVELGALLADRGLRRWARRALRAYGPVAIPLLVDLGTRAGLDLAARRAALALLARLPYQRTVDVILSRLEWDGDDARAALVPVLLRLRERGRGLRFPRRTIEALLRHEAAAARRLQRTATALGAPDEADPAARLLHRRLRELRSADLERVFQLLALQYDVRDIMGAWLRVNSDDQRRVADAREFLESLLAPHHNILVNDLAGHGEGRGRGGDREAAFLELLRAPDEWLRCCAIWAARPHPHGRVMNEIRSLAGSSSPLVAETARLVLDVPRRRVTMLTTIEKAILLERVEQFATIDSEQLAAIASIAEELTVADGDVVYREDDPGEAMYQVVDGEVVLRRATSRSRGRGPATPSGPGRCSMPSRAWSRPWPRRTAACCASTATTSPTSWPRTWWSPRACCVRWRAACASWPRAPPEPRPSRPPVRARRARDADRRGRQPDPAGGRRRDGAHEPHRAARARDRVPAAYRPER